MMLIDSVAFLYICGNSGKGKLKGKKGVICETKNLPGLEFNFFFLQMKDVRCFGICIILQPTCCCKHVVDVLKSPKCKCINILVLQNKGTETIQHTYLYSVSFILSLSTTALCTVYISYMKTVSLEWFPLTSTYSIISYGNTMFASCLLSKEHNYGVNHISIFNPNRTLY